LPEKATGDVNYWYCTDTDDLPPGLHLDIDGEITGTIDDDAQIKTYTFTVVATDDEDEELARKQLSIKVILPPKPVITTTSLPNGTRGYEYHKYVEEATGIVSEWDYDGDLPPGLYLDYDGEITGTINDDAQIKTYTFTVKATNARDVDTKQLSITVEAPHRPVIITTSLPNVKLGIYYDEYLKATGGDITWSYVSGELPEGLEFYVSDGSVYGRITEADVVAKTYTFRVKATNSLGSVEKDITITYEAPKTPIIANSNTLTNGVVGREYGQLLYLSEVTPSVWEKIIGSLPPGLEIDYDYSYGYIYGVPTEVGTYTFTVKATNLADLSGTKQFTIKINAVLQKPTISTTALPNGSVGEIYLQQIEATELADWNIVEGALPPGLYYDYDYGYITGVPVMAGTYTFKVKATNDAGNSGEKQLSITIGTTPSPIRLPQVATRGNISVQTDANSIMLSNLQSNTKIEVYNLQGKQIYSVHSGNSQILRIPVQTKGMYVVKAGSQTMRATVR
jgi:Putative Ig domain.